MSTKAQKHNFCIEKNKISSRVQLEGDLLRRVMLVAGIAYQTMRYTVVPNAMKRKRSPLASLFDIALRKLKKLRRVIRTFIQRPRRGQERQVDIMTHFSRFAHRLHNRSYSRWGYAMTTVAMAALLVACGGGGGGDAAVSPTPTPPTAPAAGTLALAAPCTATPGSTTGECLLNVTTANTAAATVMGSNGQQYPVETGKAYALKVKQPVGQEVTYTMQYGGPTPAGPVTVRAECEPGSVVGANGACGLGPYQVVYGFTPTHYPIRFKGTSCADLTVQEATNKTRWQPYPHEPQGLDFKMMWHEALPSGRLLMSVRSWLERPKAFENRYAVVINPISNVITDYEGGEGPPPDMTDTVSQLPLAGWLYSNPPFDSVIGIYAKHAAGFMIYVNRITDSVVYCRDASGDREVLSVTNSGFAFFASYSRP